MKICRSCGAENPDTGLRCSSCGAALENENTATALLGSMGGRKYGSAAPSDAGDGAASRTGTGLLGSMGGVTYEASAETPFGAGGSAPSAPTETNTEAGLLGSMGGVVYETASPPEAVKPAPPAKSEKKPASAPKEAGLAGSMGGIRYGIRPPAPPPEPAGEEEKYRPDKGLIVAMAITVVSLAAAVLLVFWNTLFGGAELYGRGIGGFANYYKPVEEEDVLEEDGVSYVGNQMVIVSSLNASQEEMEDFFSQHDMEIVGYVELIDTYQVQLDKEYTLAELHSMARELEKDPHVDSATVNAVRENTAFLAPSDPWDGNSDWSRPAYAAGNWGVVAIRAPQSWERWEPAEVRAGVLDSMFDVDNRDLNYSMTKDNEVFKYVTDPDERAHGTHVSGTIGALHNNGLGVAGVAENCVLYGYSAYRYEGTIEEVSAIAELAAQDVRVVNYSMGLVPDIRDEAIESNGMEREIYYRYASEFSQEALRHLLRKGYDFVLVCSAGNDPVGAEWASEYAYITDPEIRGRILVVGAAGIDRGGAYYQAYWSAKGPRVDVLAPGVDIFSTVPGGGAYMSGTSMAAPHVTGVCASVWAIAPELSGAQVKSIVVRTADIPVPGGDAKMVNMYAAMAAAEAEKP